jgi:acetate kinase
MTRHVVTLNAGSSSIKFALFEAVAEDLSALAIGLVEMRDEQRHIAIHDGAGKLTHEATWAGNSDAPSHADALHRILAWRRDAFPNAQVVAAGHRVVHGGIHYTTPVIVTDELLDDLRKLVPLAPLHQPHNIAGILAAREAWPHIQQVACFDTAFHRAHPFVNDVFALPRRYFEEGVRRYGFHGLSYEYVTGQLRQIPPHHAAERVVVAHLGNGASMCAIRDGQSVASSMGFTALDGLPMGTRCVQLDPDVVLYLMQEKH